MNFCPHCGTKVPNPDTDQFCMNCGAKLPVLDSPPPPAAPVPPAQPGAAAPAGAGHAAAPDAEQATVTVARPAVTGPATADAVGPPAAPDTAEEPRQFAGKELFAGQNAPEERQDAAAQDATPGLFDGAEPPSAEVAFVEAAQPEAAHPGPAEWFGQPDAAAPEGELFAGGDAPAAEGDTASGQEVQAQQAPQDPFADATPPDATAYDPGAPSPPADEDFAAATPAGAAADALAAAGDAPAADALAAAPPAAQAMEPALLNLIDEVNTGAEPPAPDFELPQPGGFETFSPGAAQLFDDDSAGPQAAGAFEDPFATANFAGPEATPAQGARRAAHPAQEKPREKKPARPVREATARPAREKTPRQQYEEDPTQAMPAVAAPPTPRRPAPPPVPLPQEEPVRRRSLLGRIFAGIGIFLAFAVITAATAFLLLFFQNKPTKVVAEFVQAVEAVDIATLEDITRVNGLGQSPTAEQWQAFCAAFSQKTELSALQNQLLQLAEDTPPTDVLYPAVSMEKKAFIPFVDQFRVNINAVSLLVPGPAGTVAQLNGVDHPGTPTEGGVLVQPLMPGRYAYRAVEPGMDANSLPITDITIFEVSAPNTLQGVTPKATVTIGNCRSDDAMLYVNEAPVPDVPVGGIAQLVDVPLGAVIRIVVMENGVAMQSSVTFADLNNTQLQFGEYAPVDGQAVPDAPASTSTPPASQEITAQEIDTLLATYYPSYLECINAQNLDAIKLSTAANNNALATRIASDSNRPYLFQFVSAAVDAASLKPVEGASTPTVQFNARFTYQYKPREGEEAYTDGSTQYTMEVVYQDGQWLVNWMTYVSEGDFNNHVLIS